MIFMFFFNSFSYWYMFRRIASIEFTAYANIAHVISIVITHRIISWSLTGCTGKEMKIYYHAEWGFGRKRGKESDGVADRMRVGE